jgi:hypothetical protein
MASAASATAVITPGVTNAIPASNDFLADLNLAGLFFYTTTGATISLTTNSTLTFEFLGSESGYNDTFSTIGGLSLTETSSFEDHFSSPILIGSEDFLAGSLLGLLNFTSNLGAAATVGDDGFGIFLPDDSPNGLNTSVFYLGYDDQITNQDDNHDDFLVRVTVRESREVPDVPEPATWATMLLGFGAIGFALRRRGKSGAIPQLA